MPSANVTYDLGTNNLRWKDLYLSGTTIRLGGQQITANATSVAIGNIDDISSWSTLIASSVSSNNITVNGDKVSGNTYMRATVAAANATIVASLAAQNTYTRDILAAQNTYSTSTFVSNAYATASLVSNAYATASLVSNAYASTSLVSNAYATTSLVSNAYATTSLVSNNYLSVGNLVLNGNVTFTKIVTFTGNVFYTNSTTFSNTSIFTGNIVISNTITTSNNFINKAGVPVGYTYFLDDLSFQFDGVKKSFVLTYDDGSSNAVAVSPNQLNINIGNVPVRPIRYIIDYHNLPEVSLFKSGFILSGNSIVFATAPHRGMSFYGTMINNGDATPPFTFKQLPFTALSIMLGS